MQASSLVDAYSKLFFPAAQGEQAVVSSWSWYFPFEQAMQSCALFTSGLKKPMLQLMHDVFRPAVLDHFPAGQSLQRALLAIPIPSDQEPATQFLHSTAPVKSLYLPATQS
jgi:hypothetical protein